MFHSVGALLEEDLKTSYNCQSESETVSPPISLFSELFTSHSPLFYSFI